MEVCKYNIKGPNCSNRKSLLEKKYFRCYHYSTSNILIINIEKWYTRVSSHLVSSIIVDLRSNDEGIVEIFTGGGLNALGWSHGAEKAFLDEISKFLESLMNDCEISFEKMSPERSQLPPPPFHNK